MPDIVKIRDLPAAAELADGDYAAIDNSTDGLRKVALGGIVNDLRADLRADLSENTKNLLVSKNENGTSLGVNYEIKNGMVSLSGTWTKKGVLDVSDLFELQAGSYVLSYIVDQAGTGISVQVRNADNTVTIATGQNATFTLDTAQDVFVRLSHDTADTKNVTYKIQIEQGTSATKFCPPVTALDYVARANFEDLYNSTVKPLGYLPSGTDLNTLVSAGCYTILSGRSFVNAPDETSGYTGLLIIYPTVNNSSVAQLTQIYAAITDYKVYVRYRPINQTTFTEWKPIIEYELNPSQHGNLIDFVDFSSNNTGNNHGVAIDILAYNVEHYQHNTGHKIGDADRQKYLLAFKKLLQWANPIVCMISEDTEYIDTNNTKSSTAYLYNYMFPTTTGSSETTIKSKIGFDKVMHDYVSTSRPGVYAIWNAYNNRKILFYTAHLSPGEGNASLRLEELQHIFSVIESENPDAYIIAGDFNTQTDTDRTNLLSVVNTNNAKIGNGGYLGWLNTMYKAEKALDNLIVSQNVFINCFDVLSNWGGSLYSDHLPIKISLTVT